MAQLFKLKYIKYKNKYNTLKKELENVEENNTNGIDLTETPTLSNPMVGGSVTTTAITPPCTGIVNPMPDVTVPMNQEGGSCAGIVNPQPAITPPVATLVTGSVVATNNKNYSINESEVNNTEDIERLFKQIGGGHKKHHSRESSDSSLFNSESSSLFGSDFDELISE